MSRFFAIAGIAALIASPAFAGSVSLFLQNGNDGGGPFNTTQFQITNTSAPGVALTGFGLTIGDTQYNFDEVYLSAENFTGGNGTQAALLTVGDRNQDSVVTDSFAYSFTNFTPGIIFTGQWDIDNDNGDFNADARTVLFRNGIAPNAVASFSFSDGSSIEYTFPDLPSQDSFTLTIPSPGTAVLLGLALAARRRR